MIPSSATVWDTGAAISPIGLRIPAIIKINVQIMSTGVKNLPIISTKRVGRIVKANTIPKKIIENTNKEILSVNGAILISKVVAAVLGGAINTPVHNTAATFKIMPGILPTTLSKALMPPPP